MQEYTFVKQLCLSACSVSCWWRWRIWRGLRRGQWRPEGAHHPPSSSSSVSSSGCPTSTPYWSLWPSSILGNPAIKTFNSPFANMLYRKFALQVKHEEQIKEMGTRIFALSPYRADSDGKRSKWKRYSAKSVKLAEQETGQRKNAQSHEGKNIDFCPPLPYL